ncbi:hypothetical protein [Rickettsiella endosymbiont of Rhagonycha lignosa]|uniref:hypothetical protein n=1 Tax=Rickettsiella endosymbiont of Rhagonycha lignosa TaxID=3077937 RepID=UPI00313B6A5F
MDSKNLLVQLNQKREHLRSLKEFLIESVQLKNGRFGFFNDSQQRLNIALMRNPQNLDEIKQLSEKVDHHWNMYTKYEDKITVLQIDIDTTKQEITELEQLLSTFPDKKAYCDFYKQKKSDYDEGDRQNSNTASGYANVSNFPFRQ